MRALRSAFSQLRVLADWRTNLPFGSVPFIHFGHLHFAVVDVSLGAGRIVPGVNAEHVPPNPGLAGELKQKALYDYCTIRANAVELACIQ